MHNCLPHHIIELSHTCLAVADGTAKQCISFQCSAILCNWATVLHSKWQRSIFRHTDYLHKNTRIFQKRSRQMGRFDFTGLFCAGTIFSERVWQLLFFLCNTTVDCVTDSKQYKIMVFCFRFNVVKQFYMICYMLLKSKAVHSPRHLCCINTRCKTSKKYNNRKICVTEQCIF